MPVPLRGRRPAADAYRLHEKYWSDSGGDVTVPVDPFQIAQLMGVSVAESILGPDESGYLSTDSLGQPVILLNENHSLTRQRFTCAHELGHLIDHENREVPIRTSWRDERASHGTNDEEIYANRFAAALLMPKQEVRRLRQTGLSVGALARRFRVSDQAMEWRLKNLGIS